MTYSVTISGSAEMPPNPSYLRLRTSATKVTKGRSVTLSAKLVDAASTLIPNYSVNLFRSNNGRARPTEPKKCKKILRIATLDCGIPMVQK